MNAILIMFHLELDAGYAMDSLLDAFLKMAQALVNKNEKIHISYTNIQNKEKQKILSEYTNIIEYDPASSDASKHVFIEKYVREYQIDIVFGFDQPVHQPAYKPLRRGGVRKIISYQGAPMSDPNKGFKLLLKKLQVKMAKHSPEHYIFESQAMAETAYQGRGVPKDRVSVVPLGVDAEKYMPSLNATLFAHKTFSIPKDRRIIYYSGHMEKRKGVTVLINAAIHLKDVLGRNDFHFLILGNRPGEEEPYLEMLQGERAEAHVTFGGYRDDIAQILPCSYIGTIASTGWDSFTVTSLEIASCGLPLLVSKLQGLAETIEEGKTGFSFKPGDYSALAKYIDMFLDDEFLRDSFGEQARARILAGFSKQRQIDSLVGVVQRVCSSS
ncbi:MAG: glycosyltransferase family 4 protein [Methylococcaceae bacterium]